MAREAVSQAQTLVVESPGSRAVGVQEDEEDVLALVNGFGVLLPVLFKGVTSSSL